MNDFWNLMNEPLSIALIGAVIAWALGRIYLKRPLWRQFEGTIIAAVKAAEKEIPNDTHNKGLARLDTALEYVISVFQEVEHRRPSDKETAELKDAIQMTHADLESSAGL